MVCEVWVESDQTCTSGNGYVSEQSNAWADKIGLSLLFSSDYSTSWCLSNWLFNTNSFFPTHPPLFHLVVEISVSITVGIWKGSCLVGNDPLPKLGRLEPEGYAGRYLYCQVAFWAKLLPDSEEIPLPFPLFWRILNFLRRLPEVNNGEVSCMYYYQWPFWPYLAIYGHLAISQCATNSGKWGIPEKNYKNVAQQW